MSYRNETTYFGLPLPTGSDKSTFTDNNTAFQAVDAALHTAYEQSGAATEDIVAIKATVANLLQADIDFQNDLDTEKGKIRNLQDKEVLQDTEIAAVKADAQDMITAYNEPTATSTHAYSAGDFFIYNDVLYRATETIAIGDTIVPDTNCTTTNVSSELIGVKTALSRLNPNRESVSVTCDGVKTYKQLMEELYSLVNLPRVSSLSHVQAFNTVFVFNGYGGGTSLIFSAWATATEGYNFKLNANDSTYDKVDLSTSPASITHKASEVPASGGVIKLIY